MRRGSRRGSWNPEEDVKERVTASEEHIKDQVKTEIEALAKVNDAQHGELAVKIDSVAKVAESGAEDVKMVRLKVEWLEGYTGLGLTEQLRKLAGRGAEDSS